MSEATVVGDTIEGVENPENFLNQEHYFTSAIYTIQKPDFIPLLNKVSREYLKKNKKASEIYPVIMSDNMVLDERLKEITGFIADTAFSILQSQGYNMNVYEIVMYDFWCQEHYKFSGQEEHIHQAVLSGFYFIDCPKNSSRVVFHDPRPAKVYSNLMEANPSMATYGSTMINYEPKPGMLMFANSWLPHSFLKNSSPKPFRFMHFNIGVNFKKPVDCPMPQTEVV